MINYYGSYDVVVCGGGTAGVTAAVTSARNGAKTLLIERVGQLGGQMNYSGPPGFSYMWLFNIYKEQVIGGFVEETYQRLLKMGHGLPHTFAPWQTMMNYSFIDPDWWGFLVYELLVEAKAEMMLHSLVTDVIKDGNVVKGVVVEHPSGRSIVMGKVIIDCTGEGEVCYQAGAQYEIQPKDKLEPSTVAFTVDGVDWDKVMKYMKENIDDMIFNFDEGITKEQGYEMIRNAKSIEEFGHTMGWVSLMNKGLETGEWHGNSGVGFFLMPKGGRILAHLQHSSHVGNTDATDVRDLTHVEIDARRQNVIAFNFFKKYVPGFENSYIVRVCAEARIRETRRIMGDYKLTHDDTLNARKFADTIGRSPFVINMRHAVGHTALALMDSAKPVVEQGSHDIPYRTMIPLGLENIMVSGKAISAEWEAHHRFLFETMVTGEAAGTAAALCVKKGITPRELEKDVSELQKNLQAQGAILYGPK